MVLKKILIVEDSPVVSLMAKRFLEERGYQVAASCPSGEEAIERVAKDTPDLILMDIMLEGELDGIEAAKIIRSNYTLPIVYMTAGTEEHFIHRALSTATYGYIIKPFEDLTLYSTVQHAYHQFSLEQKLRQDEKHYRILLDTIQTGVLIIDEQSYLITDCNASALKILQVNREEIVGLPCEDLFCLNKEDYYKKENLDRENFESILHLKEKDIFIPVIKSIKRITIDRHPYLLESFIDINQQKETEKALRKSNHEISNLLAAIDSILIGISVSEEITHWNKGAEDVFGHKREDVLGKKIFSVDMNWQWEEIFESICDSYIDGMPKQLKDLKVKRSTGQDLILGITINPIKGESGRATGCLIFGKDITKTREMELQLFHDQKLKSIGELAAGIAHEINTPTQYITENVKFLKDTFSGLFQAYNLFQKLDFTEKRAENFLPVYNQIVDLLKKIDMTYLTEEIPKTIRETLDGLSHVSRIVQSMKHFSHPNKGSRQLMDINKSLEDAAILSKNEWKYNSDLILELDKNIPLVEGYPAELTQVLINIVVNAAHAVSETVHNELWEKGKIVIRSYQKKDKVFIEIEDNGVGIPLEIQDRIFDPFFTTKEIGRGTGQGLSIAHSIINDIHNGRIFFNSILGKGTIFFIELPVGVKENGH